MRRKSTTRPYFQQSAILLLATIAILAFTAPKFMPFLNTNWLWGSAGISIDLSVTLALYALTALAAFQLPSILQSNPVRIKVRA